VHAEYMFSGLKIPNEHDMTVNWSAVHAQKKLNILIRPSYVVSKLQRR